MMMNFFNSPNPRHFHHKYIYIDERKERLKSMEKQAYCELGLQNEKKDEVRQRLHESFVRGTSHLNNDRYASKWNMFQSIGVVMILLIILVSVCYLLLSI